MQSRKKVIGFHVLSNNYFIKVYSNGQVEMVDGDSTICIEVKEVQRLYAHNTNIIELSTGNIILIYTLGYAPDIESMLAFLDFNTKSCTSTLMIPEGYLTNFCALPDNKILLTNITYGKIISCHYENGILNRDSDDNFDLLNDIVSLDNKPHMYVSKVKGLNAPTTITLENKHFGKLVREVGPNQRLPFQNKIETRIKDLIVLSNHYIICWYMTESKLFISPGNYKLDDSRDFLKIFDEKLTLRCTVPLKRSWPSAFEKMAMIGGEYIAMMRNKKKANGKKLFYIEIYNIKGKKVKDVSISNDSDQFFTLGPDGTLMSCSQLGDVTVHNLGLPLKTYEKTLLNIVESGFISGKYHKNISFEEPAKIVGEYLGLFSKNTQEIIYPEKPKHLMPRF